MSELPTWDEFEAMVNAVNTPNYSRDADEVKRKAKDALRKTFYGMHRRALENDTLRQMLVDLGVQNAGLSVSIEQERVRTALTPTSPPEPAPTPKPMKPSPRKSTEGDAP